MGPKPIQDVVPPQASVVPTPQAAEPPSGQELVGDIPVRVPTEAAANLPEGSKPADHESSFITHNSPVSVADKKVEDKPRPKPPKPKPVAAIVIACLAIVFLAAGAYFEFLANR